MGAFMVCILQQSAESIWATFAPYHKQLKPFRDASYGECTYNCTVLHCLQGLEKAVSLGWYNLN